MSIRPLRTSAAENPRTQGERIRFARLAMDLSQGQFAERLGRSGGGKISKSLVSMWERGGIKNPNNANLLAIQAVTGFAMEWLISGKGPQKVTIPSTRRDATAAAIDRELLARAIAAVAPAGTDAANFARMIGGLYDLLGDTPDLSDELLARFAKTLAHP